MPEHDPRCFDPVAVPAVFAELGAAHAVSLAPATGARMLRCEYDIPGRLTAAAPARIRSYLGGRLCAQRALRDLDVVETAPIGTGPFGAPVWPVGCAGSITHSSRLAIAVASTDPRYRGLGIDCELLMTEQVEAEVRDSVAPESDHVSWVTGSRADLPRTQLTTLIFSAKESLYKCVNPIVGAFMDFTAVRVISIDVHRGRLDMQMEESFGHGVESGLRLHAHFQADAEHVYTAVRLTTADSALGS